MPDHADSRKSLFRDYTPHGGVVCGPRRCPATQLILYLHGSNSGGAQLTQIADRLQRHFPDAVMYAPNGETNCAGFGRQLFEIWQHYKAGPFGKPPSQWNGDEKSRMQAIDSEVERVTRPLNRMLNRLMAHHGIPARRTAIVGFSQGGQTALHMAARREEPVAAVVSFSGTLLAPEKLGRETLSRPPVLLTHGEDDTVLPFSAMAIARDRLQEHGFKVETRALLQADHHDGWTRGVPAAIDFLRRHLPSTTRHVFGQSSIVRPQAMKAIL